MSLNRYRDRRHGPLGLALLLSASLWACGSQPSPRNAPGSNSVAGGDEMVGQTSNNVLPVRAAPTDTGGVADLVDAVSAAVVNITTITQKANRSPHGSSPFEFFRPHEGMRPFKRKRQGAGSGFIVDPAGYIVTNEHVVSGADRVKITLKDNRRFEATVVGRDAKLDIALLRISAKTNTTFPTVPLGDSEQLRVGESVVAVGNPFGLGHTVTKGIVSAKARSIGAGPYDDFIQTDASINPGNSGGPLFDLQGRVVGINTAIRAGANGIGFAIPVQSLRDVMGQLRDRGYVERGKLGLIFQPVTEEIATALGLDRPMGALVSEVLGGSAADRAGLVAGDVIIAVGRVPIIKATQLPRNVARFAPGSKVTIHYLRQGKRSTATATLDKLEERRNKPARSTPTPSASGSMLGMDLQDEPSGGVRVLRLTKPHQGIRRGDVITEIDGQPVADVGDLTKRIEQLQGRSTVLLKLRRGDRARYVGLPLGAP